MQTETSGRTRENIELCTVDGGHFAGLQHPADLLGEPSLGHILPGGYGVEQLTFELARSHSEPFERTADQASLASPSEGTRLENTRELHTPADLRSATLPDVARHSSGFLVRPLSTAEEAYFTEGKPEELCRAPSGQKVDPSPIREGVIDPHVAEGVWVRTSIGPTVRQSSEHLNVQKQIVQFPQADQTSENWVRDLSFIDEAVCAQLEAEILRRETSGEEFDASRFRHEGVDPLGTDWAWAGKSSREP